MSAHPVFWGGAGYPALWNEAPFLNNQDLFIVKDDYTRVFGKHFMKAGVLASWNKKNRRHRSATARTRTRGSGAPPGSAGPGRRHRQRPRRLPAEGHDVGILRSVGGPLGAAALARSRDVCGRLVAGQRASRFDYGIRYSLFFNPYTADDQITSFVPALFNPALGADPCNGLLQPPGSEHGARTPALSAAPTARTAR